MHLVGVVVVIYPYLTDLYRDALCSFTLGALHQFFRVNDRAEAVFTKSFEIFAI